MTKQTITYYYRGLTERGNGSGYDWHEGWSAQSDDGLPLYPWNTKRECQHEARLKGVKAEFVRNDAQVLA